MAAGGVASNCQLFRGGLHAHSDSWPTEITLVHVRITMVDVLCAVEPKKREVVPRNCRTFFLLVGVPLKTHGPALHSTTHLEQD